jgi:site-specific DNA recombinase
MAKGTRRANYTKSLGEGKKWETKPESEWVVTACPAIVTEEVWNSCNQILDAIETHRKPMGKKPVHLFAGILTCHCGGKMYVPSRTQKYVCNSCKKTNISTTDIEEIYYAQLKSFLLTKEDHDLFLTRASEAIQAKLTELNTLISEKERVKKEMDKLIQLHSKEQIPTEDFSRYYAPLSTQYKQIEASIPELEAQLDFIKNQQLNSSFIVDSATDLYQKWPALDQAAKRNIVEEVTESILIDKEDIEITFNYTPAPPVNYAK